ncbi:MAG: serine/threonine protein kinase, partial [Planctomycetaceae bacterium]|nr:serine/threonine protein kinase [Planctomycetaceae bacterium]
MPFDSGLLTTGFPPGDVTPSLPENNSSTIPGIESLLDQIAAQSHFEERYEQRGKLAEGGMGEIHRAFDKVISREVAIKIMKRGGQQQHESPVVRDQFLKEAKVGGRLLHPNILPVFDLGVNRKGVIYYTMRLVEGDSLQNCLDALDKGVATNFVMFPLRRLVEAFLSVCEGVDFAHQNGVLHLDLKPHNILVSGFKEVFVIDWGLARVDDLDDTARLIDLYDLNNLGLYVNTGVIGGKAVGTPGYMAPEQA